jgi:hypothetical protein
MSFASGVRKLRRCALSMLETHIVMSFLIFHLVHTLVLRHALLHVLFLSSLMDLTIAIVSFVILLASIVIFRCDSKLPNPVLRANSFPIGMWSWPS